MLLRSKFFGHFREKPIGSVLYFLTSILHSNFYLKILKQPPNIFAANLRH